MRILRMSHNCQLLLHCVKINPSVVRLFKVFGCLLIEWHWIGCTMTTMRRLRASSCSTSYSVQYLRDYFCAVMVMTGVIKDIMPESDVQYLFTTCAIICSALGCAGTACPMCHLLLLLNFYDFELIISH